MNSEKNSHFKYNSHTELMKNQNKNRATDENNKKWKNKIQIEIQQASRRKNVRTAAKNNSNDTMSKMQNYSFNFSSLLLLMPLIVIEVVAAVFVLRIYVGLIVFALISRNENNILSYCSILSHSSQSNTRSKPK